MVKIIDRFTLKDKLSENMIRDLYLAVERMGNSNMLVKEDFVEIQSVSIELFIILFKRLEDNSK